MLLGIGLLCAEIFHVTVKRCLRTAFDKIEATANSALLTRSKNLAKVRISVEAFVSLGVAVDMVCLLEPQCDRMDAIYCLNNDNRCFGFDGAERQCTMSHWYKPVSAGDL